MAYERHNWQCGDVVTAERLNNIEDGVEEALECCGSSAEEFLVSFTLSTTNTMDRTVDEIVQAYNDGKKITACSLYGDAPLSTYYLVYANAFTPDFEFATVTNSGVNIVEVNKVGGQDNITVKYAALTFNIQ